MTTKKISLLLLNEREIGAAQFKAHCLEVLDEVERLGIEITITKHRKPVAKLVPARARNSEPFCGWYKGEIKILGDIAGPIDEEWNAEKGIID